MQMLTASIRHCLTGLARFTGRDRLRDFWPFVGVWFAALMLITMAVMAPTLMATFAKMQAFAAAHPDQAEVYRSGTSYSITIRGHHPELTPDLRGFMLAMQLLSAVSVVLLAAAVSRRLHDTGRTALWGLAPLPFLAIAMAVTPRIFNEAAGGQIDYMAGFASLIGVLFLNNVVYMAAILRLAFLLSRDSDKAANRYGDPVAA